MHKTSGCVVQPCVCNGMEGVISGFENLVTAKFSNFDNFLNFCTSTWLHLIIPVLKGSKALFLCLALAN